MFVVLLDGCLNAEVHFSPSGHSSNFIFEANTVSEKLICGQAQLILYLQRGILAPFLLPLHLLMTTICCSSALMPCTL